MRDSAGVQIVESFAPQSIRPGLQLEAEPTVEIGAAEGHPMYLFHRVVGAVRLSDGTIAVANAGDNTLRFFSESGEYLASAGGSGGGPGEFSSLSRLIARGDSVYAGSPPHLFRRDGTFRSLTLPGRRSLVGVFSDGTLLAEFADPLPRATQGTAEETKTYSLWRAGEEAGESGSLPFLKWVAVPDGDVSLMILGPVAHEAVGSDRFFHGYPERFDIGVFDADLQLVRRIRRGPAPPSVSAQDVATFVDIILGPAEGASSDQADLRRLYMSFPTAETVPAHGALLADTEGYLWVQRFTIDGYARSMGAGRLMPPAHEVEWDVFDGSGIWVDSLTLPAGFMPSQIGGSFVLGVHYSDLGVESVRLYHLDRGA